MKGCWVAWSRGVPPSRLRWQMIEHVQWMGVFRAGELERETFKLVLFLWQGWLKWYTLVFKLNGKEHETKPMDQKKTERSEAGSPNDVLEQAAWKLEGTGAGIRWDGKYFGGGAVLRSRYMSYFLHQLVSFERSRIDVHPVSLRIHCITRVLTLCL